MASKTRKLTVRTIEAEPPHNCELFLWDEEIKGFGLRIWPASKKYKDGKRVFLYQYRNAARETKRLKIGEYPAMRPEQARQIARQKAYEVQRGDDPRAKQEADRNAATIRSLSERYIAEYLPRKRPASQVRDRAMLEADILPRIGRIKVQELTLDQVERLHAEVTRRAPIRANRVLALLSKMLTLAVKWRMRPDNPCRDVDRNPENKRQRYLTTAEIARLVPVLRAYGGQSAACCLLFLLLTGARESEAMHATWGQIDMAAGVWTKPSAHTKQKKEHRVPLSGPARQLLQSIRPEQPADTDFVFPGRKPGQPLKQIRLAWAAVTKAAGISGARIHDLRHSYASILASSGASLPLIGALLGHTQPATTARYAHLLDDPMREATERVGAIVSGEGSAEIIPMNRAKF